MLTVDGQVPCPLCRVVSAARPNYQLVSVLGMLEQQAHAGPVAAEPEQQQDQKQPTPVSAEERKVLQDTLAGHDADSSNSDLPLHLRVAVDVSGSMELDCRLENAKKGCMNLINTSIANRSKSKVSFAWFNDYQHGGVARTGPRATELLATIQDLAPGGGTAMYDAVFEGMQYLRQNIKPNFRHALVVLTDGEDRDSKHTKEEMKALMERPEIPGFMATFILINAEQAQIDLLTSLCAFVHTKVVLVKTQSTQGHGIAASFDKVIDRLSRDNVGLWDASEGAVLRSAPSLHMAADDHDHDSILMPGMLMRASSRAHSECNSPTFNGGADGFEPLGAADGAHLFDDLGLDRLGSLVLSEDENPAEPNLNRFRRRLS